MRMEKELTLKAEGSHGGKSDCRIRLVRWRVACGDPNLLFRRLVKSTIASYLHDGLLKQSRALLTHADNNN